MGIYGLSFVLSVIFVCFKCNNLLLEYKRNNLVYLAYLMQLTSNKGEVYG